MDRTLSALMLTFLLWAGSAEASVLWSDLGATLVHETGPGVDILGGAVRRDDSASDTLYFKFHIDPRSDVSTEEYSAAFQLFAGDAAGLGVGNSWAAWAYSAFNTDSTGEANKVVGDMDLHSARPESSSSPGVFLPYELPRRGLERTILFKVEFVPGGHDRVTVWLNPDLRPGATEATQPESLTTRFTADASFDQIRLLHRGGGDGWTFSDMAIATTFSDFVSETGADAAGRGVAAGLGASELTFRSWQREQGLPQNSVHALAQTRDGYLWIGSDEGVTRFDGVRFESFGLREGLRSSRVRVLWAGSDGALWIGTSGGGLARWNKGRFTSFTLNEGLPADSVTALAEDNQGHLWVGTEAGLAIYQDGLLTPLPKAAEFKNRVVTTLYRDRQGAMWVGAAGAGVFRSEGGRFVRLEGAAVGSLLGDPHCLLEDRAGRLWFGVGDDYVVCRDHLEWRRYRIPRHLTRPYVSTLVEQADGTVWAGSVSEGLFQFQGGQLAAINAANGLSDNMVESLLTDREGNLWVGTAAGLNRLRRRNLLVFGQNEGLGYGIIQGLAEVAPGIIWAGKPGDGLYGWDGRHFSRVAGGDLVRQLPDVGALLRASDTTCWVAGASGLFHFTNLTTEPTLIGPPALPTRSVSALAQDREGSVWAGTREGDLWSCRSGQWTRQTNFTQSHTLTAIVPSPDGSLWLGTEGGGLYQFRDHVKTHLDKRTGLLSDLVRTLYLDAHGTLWIGTAGGGLSACREGSVFTATTRDGLPDNTISIILEDDTAHLWLGSNRGLACVSKADLDGLRSGAVPALYPQVYGRAEGMLSEECTGGFCPAGLKTKSGHLWFSTLKGIIAIDPRPRHPFAPPPPVVLESVLVDNQPMAFSTQTDADLARGAIRPSLNVTEGASGQDAQPSAGHLTLPPGKHRLEFRYTGLSLTAPERVRFRYRLEGLNPDWVEAGTRRTANYDYVPPGEYRFRAAACNSEGVWNDEGASLSLTLRPRFYQAWWFRGLAALGLLASVAAIARFAEKRKLHRQLRQLEQERALERERARIAQDLHDDLGSSLTRISLLSDLLKADKEIPAQIETHAGKISLAAGQTVRSLEEIVWALRPGSDSLQSLVEYIAHFANELFDGDHARCRLDLPHDLPVCTLPPETRHNLFLVVKEALTNALKHASAREVQVQARISADSLELVVQDDGKGFNLQIPGQTSKRQGLGNMHRRAEAMGALLELQSAPGGGTLVRLRLKLPVAAGTARPR